MAAILNYFKKKPKKPSEALRDTTVGEEELRDFNSVGRGGGVCRGLSGHKIIKNHKKMRLA